MSASILDFYCLLRAELGSLGGDNDLPAKLITLTWLVAEDDIAYVPDYLTKMLSSPRDIGSLMDRIHDAYRDPSELDRLGTFIRSNAHIAPMAIDRLPRNWRAVWTCLEPMVSRDREFVVAVLCFGLTIALYEWKDRQRGSVPYDEALHGRIKFSEVMD